MTTRLQVIALIGAGSMLGWFVSAYRVSAPAQTVARPTLELPGALAAALASLEHRFDALETRLSREPVRCAAVPVPVPPPSPAPPSPTAPGAVDAPPVGYHPALMTGALAVIEDAQRAGSWIDADRDALMAKVMPLSVVDRTEVLRQLAVAINSGALPVETTGLAF